MGIKLSNSGAGGEGGGQVAPMDVGLPTTHVELDCTAAAEGHFTRFAGYSTHESLNPCDYRLKRNICIFLPIYLNGAWEATEEDWEVEKKGIQVVFSLLSKWVQAAVAWFPNEAEHWEATTGPKAELFDQRRFEFQSIAHSYGFL